MCRWLARWLALVALVATAWPQELAPEVLLLARLKSRMRQELAQMPNYTCVETIQRFHKSAGRNASLKPLDTIRLEVAAIGDREMYSWLGDRSFQKSDPSAFIGSGMIGSGMFASDLRSIFVTNQATIRYIAQDKLDGRRAAQYAFRIPVFLSGYTIEAGGAKGIAGMRGSFWVDSDSLDLLRVEIHAEDIPPDLPLREASSVVDYARVRVGDRDVLLPRTGTFEVVEFSGVQNRNVIEFTHCRSFRAESAIRFDSAPEPAAAPAGLLVPILLASPLTNRSTVGEPVEAKVAGNVTAGGEILIPNGAVIRGRVRRLDHYAEPDDYFVVSLEFDTIEAGGSLLRFYADLESLGDSAGVEWSLSNSRSSHVRIQDLPGVGTFFIQGASFKIPPGARMTWRTRALR